MDDALGRCRGIDEQTKYDPTRLQPEGDVEPHQKLEKRKSADPASFILAKPQKEGGRKVGGEDLTPGQRPPPPSVPVGPSAARGRTTAGAPGDAGASAARARGPPTPPRARGAWAGAAATFAVA